MPLNNIIDSIVVKRFFVLHLSVTDDAMFPCIQVNEQIIKYACVLYDCDLCETKHSSFLASCGRCLMERSGIDYEGWSTMKLATALKILCFPDDDESYDDLVNHNIL